MLIHGRLILTANGIMLDEVRSLLQKSLRRKDANLVSKSARELLSFGKDQLPWKSLLTFLFEDHCLCDSVTLAQFSTAVRNNDKFKALELLFKTRTCRMAACLPVIALEQNYAPVGWNPDISVDSAVQGLVRNEPGCINTDLLLLHLKGAWINKDETGLITYMKLASMCVDHERRLLTQKGTDFLLNPNVKKLNVALVVLSLLFKNSDAQVMKEYLRCCFDLASLPEAPLRLILFTPVVKLFYGDRVNPSVMVDLGTLDWKNAVLDEMPSFAVDKHTFRGKFGKGTSHILKSGKPSNMTDEQFQNFHGERPKKTLEHFLLDSIMEKHPAIAHNPYWERTKHQYFNRPKKLQKTIRMTAEYLGELKQLYPGVFNLDIKLETFPDQVKPGTKRKLTLQGTSKCQVDRTASNVTMTNKSKKTKLLSSKQTRDVPVLKGPLLQLPTGSAKVHTCLDVTTGTVWKGPYTDQRLDLTVFNHRVMKTVCNDEHTLDITMNGNYICFPLIKSKEAKVEVVQKKYYDCIMKKDIDDGQFVSRESLGVIQLHKLPAAQIAQLPMTIWAHFLFRFALNIGDSGLYNALTDSSLSFVYGIDMEEKRATVRGKDLLNLMFVKLPRAEIRQEILNSVKHHKEELLNILTIKLDFDLLVNLAQGCRVALDVEVFKQRLEEALNAIRAI